MNVTLRVNLFCSLSSYKKKLYKRDHISHPLNIDTFWKNPQFLLDLKKPDPSSNKATALVALMQKYRRVQLEMGVEELGIGFTIYKVSDKHVYKRIIHSNYRQKSIL